MKKVYKKDKKYGYVVKLNYDEWTELLDILDAFHSMPLKNNRQKSNTFRNDYYNTLWQGEEDIEQAQ